MARRGYVVCGVLLVACSSSERVDKRVSTTHAAHATLDLLRTYPDIAPRTTGLTLTRTADGWHGDLDPAPATQTGPRWIDTRDLQTGFHATLPARAGQPLHVGVSDTVWIDITAEGDAPVEAQHVEGALVYAGARAGHDVVLTAQRRHLEELRVLRTPASGSSLKYRVKLGPGVAELRVREGIVEVVDRTGSARLRSDPWFAMDAHHQRIDVVPVLSGEGSERVLTAKLSLEGAAYPVAIDPGWGSPVSMAIPRRYHQATVLPSGKVLVTGGESASSSDITSSAELFDPTTRTWTVVHAMNKPRTHHASVLLPSGKVLAIGNFYGSDCSIGSGSELYDPASDSWTAGPFMGTPRGDAGVAVLSSGKVIVGGGRTCGGVTDPSSTADVYDPGTNTFKAVGNSMSAQHATPAAQPFGTDKAVIAGGWPGYGSISNAEIYDAATNTFTAAPKMSKDRQTPMSVTLADGRPLVIGGSYYSSSWYAISTIDTFVPAGGIFSGTAVAAMPTNRQLGGAARLSTGKVLVAFGGDGYPSNAYATMSVLYDPTSNTWSNAGNVTTDRWETVMVPLAGGAALAMGGRIGSSPNTASVEIWADAVASGSSCVSNAQCTTGFCADGVCCDRACTGSCEACAESGSVGTCKLVTGTPRGTRTACVGTGTCGGTCDGTATGCTYASSSVVCIAPTCIGGTATGAAYCNGAGTCGLTPSPVACAPYGCGATGCKTTCAGDADCDAASYCKGTTCVAKEKQGDPCTSNGACATGFCADGVCCTTACGEACKACNLSGSIGVCTTQDPCPSGDAGVDATPDATPDAEPDSTPSIDAIAETPAPNWGSTPKVDGSFQKCVKGSECATGFCVEGICCDSPCTDRCHSCALITSPGKCTVEPIGVDLKNECGPALTCLGTCGGGSECIGSGSGTMCGRNRCTGPTTGVGPAYCPGPGGKCDTDDAVPFDCGPYTCEPAFGACRTTCASSADCAHDYLCDIPSGTCQAIPPAEDASGCAVSEGKLRGSGAGVVALLLALAGIARRQRRA